MWELASIAPGQDAELVLISLGQNETLRDLLYRHPVSPYLGQALEAVVTQTWVRGRPVYTNGQVSDSLRARLLRPDR